MPLILAIENNRQQRAQLTAIVRGLGAELVLAESTEHALEALGNRIPDLILSPLLLSQQDETALTNRLRELGDGRSTRADALDSDTGHAGCEIARQTVDAAQR